MEINFKDYLTEEQIQKIVADELRISIRGQINKDNAERLLTNTAYYIVWEEVDKVLDFDVKEFIKEKVVNIIKEMGRYNVFRSKDSNYESKDSLAQIYLNQYVEENKNIINRKVVEIMQELDAEDIRNQLYDLIYQVVEDRIVGKKEDK